MIFIEPIMLLPMNDYVSRWYHPKIKNLAEECLYENQSGNLTGNLVKIYIEFTKNRSVQIILLTDDDGMENILEDDTGMTHYSDQLAILLNNELWIPNGKPFSLTPYGEIFNKIYPLYHNSFYIVCSSDVSIATDGMNWWFDTLF